MRISEKALYIFAASVAGSACTAFLPSRVALSSVSVKSAFSRGIGNEKLLSYATTAVTRSRSRSTTLQMNVFSSLFGGGAQQSTINYTTLEFPGNELGQMALEGKVVVNSERFPNLKAATFAGGCFWGLELAYQRVPGVVYTAVGYTQGPELTPNYGQVCSGATGHTEAVLVYYDPKECSYENLLDTFFNRVDPTTVNGQGNDFGPQYRTGVYYHTKEQEEAAKAKFEKEKENYRKPIASECKAAQVFWPAEKYHQQYLEKGGRLGMAQSAEKGCTDKIRCYG